MARAQTDPKKHRAKPPASRDEPSDPKTRGAKPPPLKF